MDHLCYLCLVFVMLSYLFIAALWSSEGKGLTSVTFPYGILGQMWYLIVSIPDPCCLYYFQDQLLLNAGQKYCRMPQEEHSAILSTFI